MGCVVWLRWLIESRGSRTLHNLARSFRLMYMNALLHYLCTDMNCCGYTFRLLCSSFLGNHSEDQLGYIPVQGIDDYRCGSWKTTSQGVSVAFDRGSVTAMS